VEPMKLALRAGPRPLPASPSIATKAMITMVDQSIIRFGGTSPRSTRSTISPTCCKAWSQRSHIRRSAQPRSGRQRHGSHTEDFRMSPTSTRSSHKIDSTAIKGSGHCFYTEPTAFDYEPSCTISISTIHAFRLSSGS